MNTIDSAAEWEDVCAQWRYVKEKMDELALRGRAIPSVWTTLQQVSTTDSPGTIAKSEFRTRVDRPIAEILWALKEYDERHKQEEQDAGKHS